MTEEQIKQNAEEYASKVAPAKKHKTGIPLAINHTVMVSFIAGAHSRDEEVNHWKESYEELAEIADDLQKERQTLMIENVKLRNPWISVDDVLPPEFKPVIVMFESGIIINAFVTMVKDEPAWHPSVKIPIGSDVMFWMPIPELKKEE